MSSWDASWRIVEQTARQGLEHANAFLSFIHSYQTRIVAKPRPVPFVAPSHHAYMVRSQRRCVLFDSSFGASKRFAQIFKLSVYVLLSVYIYICVCLYICHIYIDVYVYIYIHTNI